ncbi:hypothetical protein ACHAXT_008572 [Thalassiosira profunda]
MSWRLVGALLWTPMAIAFMSPLGIGRIVPRTESSSPLLATAAEDPSPLMLVTSTPSSMTSSLASSYVIRIHPPTDEGGELKWELHPLSCWEEPNQGEGTLALHALSDCAQLDYEGGAAACTIRCQWATSDLTDAEVWRVGISTSTTADEAEDTVPRDLLCILSRIILQSAALQISINTAEKNALLHATLPLLEGEGCQKLILSDLLGDGGGGSDPRYGVRHLFAPLDPDYANGELVDMSTAKDECWALCPDHEDVVEGLASRTVPDVYVHQRTSTKQIFPSLYDMFVGGVSTSGEPSRLTAAREVAEELGLTRALNIMHGEGDGSESNPLSEKLFQCTVCTSYNRCVVSLFTYKCDAAQEDISWQEEEVAWGEYMPYPVVEMAGDLSIDRLVKEGAWPGSDVYNENRASHSSSDRTEEAIAKMKRKYRCEQQWETWDFVPDGLLVWEAWKEFVTSNC